MKSRDLIGICTAIALCAFAGSASAQQSRQLQLQTMTKEQMAQADAVDVFYSIAATNQDAQTRAESMRNAPATVGLMARRSLAILFYPIALGPDLDVRNDTAAQEQIRAFETRLKTARVPSISGLVPAPDSEFVVIDGRLNTHELTALQKASRLATVTPILTLSGQVRVSIHTLSEDWGLATARGTLVMRGEQIAYPVNWVQIECEKEARRCELQKTEIAGPTARTLSFSAPDAYNLSQRASTESYDITRWSSDVIEARSVPDSDRPECRFTTLTLNAVTKTVSMVTQDGGKPCVLPGGGTLPPLEAPRVVTLANTEEVFSQHFGEIFAYVEQLQGPLAELGYRRPFLGASTLKPEGR